MTSKLQPIHLEEFDEADLDADASNTKRDPSSPGRQPIPGVVYQSQSSFDTEGGVESRQAKRTRSVSFQGVSNDNLIEVPEVLEEAESSQRNNNASPKFTRKKSSLSEKVQRFVLSKDTTLVSFKKRLSKSDHGDSVVEKTVKRLKLEKIGLLRIVCLVSIVIGLVVVYVEARDRDTFFAAAASGVTEVLATAPTKLEIVGPDAGHCTGSTSWKCQSAAFLVSSAEELLEQSRDPRRNNTVDFAVLAHHREALINDENQEYVYAVEKVPTGHAREPKYVMRAHSNVALLDRTATYLNELLLEEFCPSGHCDLVEVFATVFNRTNLGSRRVMLIRYPWYDPVTHDEIEKQAIVQRVDEAIFLGAGFTVGEQTSAPDMQLIGYCSVAYVGFLCIAFVFPGQLLRRHIKEFQSSFLAMRYIVVLFVVLPTLMLMYYHSLELVAEPTITREQLLELRHTMEETAVTLAGLALALAFFASTMKHEAQNVMQSILYALIFSVMAILPLHMGTSSKYFWYEYNVRSCLVANSIMSLLWLFIYLLVKYFNTDYILEV